MSLRNVVFAETFLFIRFRVSRPVINRHEHALVTRVVFVAPDSKLYEVDMRFTLFEPVAYGAASYKSLYLQL